jgi:hypothetical protein
MIVSWWHVVLITIEKQSLSISLFGDLEEQFLFKGIVAIKVEAISMLDEDRRTRQWIVTKSFVIYEAKALRNDRVADFHTRFHFYSHDDKLAFWCRWGMKKIGIAYAIVGHVPYERRLDASKQIRQLIEFLD